MEIVERTKKSFKKAVKNGKVVYVIRPKEKYSNDKIPWVSPLNLEWWKHLQKDQLCLGTTISSKKYNYGNLNVKRIFKSG